MKENGMANSMDLLFIHTALLTLLVFWLRPLEKKSIISEITDKNGWMLILGVTISGSEYILVNIYNANIESEQLKVLNDLSELTG